MSWLFGVICGAVATALLVAALSPCFGHCADRLLQAQRYAQIEHDESRVATGLFRDCQTTLDNFMKALDDAGKHAQNTHD